MANQNNTSPKEQRAAKSKWLLLVVVAILIIAVLIGISLTEHPQRIRQIHARDHVSK